MQRKGPVAKHEDLSVQLSETDLGSFVIAGKSTLFTASSLQLALSVHLLSLRPFPLSLSTNI